MCGLCWNRTPSVRRVQNVRKMTQAPGAKRLQAKKGEKMYVEGGLHSHTLSDIDMKLWFGKPLSRSQQAALRRHKASEAKKNKRRGLKLKEFRKRIGVSQSTLARLLRVSRRSICHYERGDHAPRRETQWLLCYLGYDWRDMKWSLRRLDAIRRIGDMETLCPESVLIFWCRWLTERGDEVSDFAYSAWEMSLTRWLDRPVSKWIHPAKRQQNGG